MVCVCLSLYHKIGSTALILASSEGHSPTVKLLLEAGANTEAEGKDEVR
jgi:ankyrin repeat protein